MKAALVISAADNVATALEALQPGATITLAGVRVVRPPDPAPETTVTVVDAIPRGHKVALRPIAAGGAVVKYGSPIGTAATDIAAGAHVHTHNVASARGRGDLHATQQSDSRIAEPLDQ